MTSEDAKPPRPSGRPATIDPDAVAGLALGLFAEHGYENTSMEDIAKAAGIGRKSLYRYFASKADLVWGGSEPVVEASTLAFGSFHSPGKSDGGVLAGLRAAAIAGVAVIPDLSVTRGRLGLIAEHPELTSRSYESLAPQRERALAFLTENGLSPSAARYLSAAYLAATFEAWMQWAAGSEPDPTPYLLAALEVLNVPLNNAGVGQWNDTQDVSQT